MSTSNKSKKKNLLIGNSVYIIGHKKPDLDSIASAYAYQQYRHSKGDFNYIAVRCGKPNGVTSWVFDHLKIDMPMLMQNVAGCKLVLVDHTDPEQRPDGWEDADIIEVLDHHKLKLETKLPPKITIRPYGSTCTLVGEKLLYSHIPIPENLAALMLAGILDDTLALRSPITTQTDKTVAGELSAIAKITDLGAFAQKLFNKKDNWARMSESNIVSTDMKDYEMGDKRIRISQVETMNNRKLEKREKELLKEMKKTIKDEHLDLYLVMLTDLITNDCILLSAGDETQNLEKIFNTKFINKNKVYLPGVLSRKRQVVPKLITFYGEDTSSFPSVKPMG